MRAFARRNVRLAVVMLCGLALVACSSAVAPSSVPVTTPTAYTQPAPGVSAVPQPAFTQASIAQAGRAGWTTPAPTGYQANASQVRPGTCYVAPQTASLPTPPCPTDCPPVTRPTSDQVVRPVAPRGRIQAAPRPVMGTTPPPPAPRASYAADVQQVPAPMATAPANLPPECACPPAAAPTRYVAQVPPRSYDGCGLPCDNGISQWHVRGLGGIVFYDGDDPGEECGYAGVDLGRTFCGCWGLDLFYRWNSGQFDRQVAGGIAKDGGDWHHVGVKVTKEFAFGPNSPFYAYVGAGPQYFWTEDYISNDEGWGFFGEVGLGYALSRNFRIRLGVDFHGVDTKVTRENPANDGQDRWLWLIAPNIGVEFDW